MREILFRGKQTYNGEWIEGSLIHADLVDGRSYTSILPADEISVHPLDWPYLCCETGTIDGRAFPVKPETVGQFTGMTDKNGKRIFEGDILDTPDRLVKVTWFARNAQFDCDFMKHAHGIIIENFKGIDPRDFHLYEVIGNIHDNPELLEGSE